MNSIINVLRKKTTTGHLKEIERRTEKRLELLLSMTIFGCKAKTKNISPNGVYFEATTKTVENYSLGKETMVFIEGTYSKPVLTERNVIITGFGEIVRIDNKGSINHHKKLGVALKFSKEPYVFI